MIWALVPMGQHELAPTNAPIGSFVHWLGRDFSLGTKCELTIVHLLGVELFLGFFFLGCFFPNFDLTYLTTIYLPFWPYLPIKNQELITNSPIRFTLHSPPNQAPTPYMLMSFVLLPIYPPSPLPTQG